MFSTSRSQRIGLALLIVSSTALQMTSNGPAWLVLFLAGSVGLALWIGAGNGNN